MKHSRAVAFSGMITALSFVAMIMTGIIPFGTFAFPALAGLAILIVKIEYGYHFALLCYIATSVLSILFCPDKTAMIVFVLLLGYYPLLKIWLEHKISTQWIRILLKGLVFTASGCAGFGILSLFFPAELYSEGPITSALLIGFFIMGLITFFIYDIANRQILAYYIIRIKNRR